MPPAYKHCAADANIAVCCATISDMPLPLKRTTQEFFNFVREQGVITLAIGFLIGGAVSKLVTSLITSVIDPIVGLFLGSAGNLKEATFMLGSATITWGALVSATIDFLVIALLVYLGVKLLGVLDKEGTKKEGKK